MSSLYGLLHRRWMELLNILPVSRSPASDADPWAQRDVLVGALRNAAQLDINLTRRFYHIPASQLDGAELPIRYIALYQSKKHFGAQAGIRYYGRVTRCVRVRRCDITELPSASTALYYRFTLQEWKILPEPIAPGDMGCAQFTTSRFLLERCSLLEELGIRSREEFDLYGSIRERGLAAARGEAVPPLTYGDVAFRFDANAITLAEGARVIACYDTAAFQAHPYKLFQQMVLRLNAALNKTDV